MDAKRDLAIIALITIATTVILWLPFTTRAPSFWGIKLPEGGFEIILRNYDGLNYIIVAKSLYDPSLIAGFPQLSVPPIYFASHFPGYPLIIKAISPLFGYLNGMLIVTVGFAILSAWALYLMAVKLGLTKNPLFLTMVFLLLPARFWIVRSVGAPETMFIFLIIVTIYFFTRGAQTGHHLDFWIAGASGAAAQLVRSPGILIFIAAVLYLAWEYWRGKKLLWQSYPLLLIPATLLGIFLFFDKTYGDVLAYFHSGDNIHLTLPPFPVFNTEQFWVGSIWLEDIVWFYLLYTGAVVILFFKRLYPMAFFALTFLLASMFVAHRDIARYGLPMAPFALIAYEGIISRKEFKIALTVVVIGMYLFALNFISDNTFPFYDLTPYR